MCHCEEALRRKKTHHAYSAHNASPPSAWKNCVHKGGESHSKWTAGLVVLCSARATQSTKEMKERSLEESNLDGLLLAGMITMRCPCTKGKGSTLEIDETKTKWMNSALYPAGIESIAENSPNPYDNGLTGLECSKRSSQSVEQKTEASWAFAVSQKESTRSR